MDEKVSQLPKKRKRKSNGKSELQHLIHYVNDVLLVHINKLQHSVDVLEKKIQTFEIKKYVVKINVEISDDED
jgi:hypothetical protein